MSSMFPTGKLETIYKNYTKDGPTFNFIHSKKEQIHRLLSPTNFFEAEADMKKTISSE